MRGGNLIFTTSDEIVSDSQVVEDNLTTSRYGRKIKFWVILLIIFIAISAFTNMLATGNKPTAEEQLVCVSLGYDYYEPGDWDCEEIREDYDAYRVQILISNLAFFPIGISLMAIFVNLRRKMKEK